MCLEYPYYVASLFFAFVYAYMAAGLSRFLRPTFLVAFVAYVSSPIFLGLLAGLKKMGVYNVGDIFMRAIPDILINHINLIPILFTALLFKFYLMKTMESVGAEAD